LTPLLLLDFGTLQAAPKSFATASTAASTAHTPDQTQATAPAALLSFLQCSCESYVITTTPSEMQLEGARLYLLLLMLL
jgi:hypothetical protein